MPVKFQSKLTRQTVDMKSAKALLLTNPFQVYTVQLDKNLLVDMRLHTPPPAAKQGFKTAKEGFKQAWKEAMTGKTHPLSELWTDI